MDKPKILLVDDDLQVTRSLARVFRRTCEVETVLSVEDAEEFLARGEEVHLILCDLLLPERGGVDFYRALKKEGSPFTDRVAFMTGLGEDAQDAAVFPEVPCLGKPLNIDLVVELARRGRQRALD